MIEQLLVLGVVMLLGFFSLAFFERTKIPDVLLLLLIGVLLGPVFGIVDPAYFISLAPLVGTLALIIVLFDAGLGLNLFKVFGELSRTTVFTVVVFALSCGAATALLHFAFGWRLLYALILGAIVGGSSSNIVVPILSRLGASENTKTILSLESVLTDALCIVATVALVKVATLGSFDAAVALHDVASAFSIAAVAGFAFGMFWIGILRRFYGKPFGYVVTLAILFIMYSLVEALRGSGAVAVLVFSIVLGNSQEIARMFKLEGDYSLDKSIKTVQTEISFFVRTFFFVFLGLVFSLGALTVQPLLLAGALTVALIIARYIGVRLLVMFSPSLRSSATLLTTMMPRGLAAAVLAFLPAESGIQIPLIVDIVFLVILFTNIVATIGAFASENGKAPVSAPAAVRGKPHIVAAQGKRKG
ncbi:MAG: cation:proton antiporter [Candidatus Micrarchaeota archaeon]